MKKMSRTWGGVILAVVVVLGWVVLDKEALARDGGRTGGVRHSGGMRVSNGAHYRGTRVGGGRHFTGTRVVGGTRFTGTTAGSRVMVVRPSYSGYRVTGARYLNGPGFNRPMGAVIRVGTPFAGSGFIGAQNLARGGFANCFGGGRFFVRSGFGYGYFNRQFPCYSLPAFAGYCPVYFYPPMYCLSAPIILPLSGYDTVPAEVSPPPVTGIYPPGEEIPVTAVPPELQPPVQVPATQPETPNGSSASSPVIVIPE